ncbi:hypothetical protein BTR23_04095 [Alkalihalophilus pseudofirmus]|nr:hypothetical protein BTR23_04095 [Alkalihalophilus pseudofirmus]
MNIIENVQHIKFSFIDKEPTSTLTHAYVYVNDLNEYRVVKNGDRLSKSQVRTGKYKKLYTVNMQQQLYSFRDEVLSATRGRRFSIDLNLDLAVKDPGLVVQQNAGEIGVICDRNLPIWVQRTARDFEINEDVRLARYIEDFYETSELVSILRSAGIEVLNVNVFVKPSARDLKHDEELVDIERNREKKDYSDTMNHLSTVQYAKRISKEIRESLEEGDYFTAILIAEQNDTAKKMVEAQYQQDRSLRIDIQNQMKKLALDGTVDRVEVKESIAKLELLFPSMATDMKETLATSQEKIAASKDPLAELDNTYESLRNKGE